MRYVYVNCYRRTEVSLAAYGVFDKGDWQSRFVVQTGATKSRHPKTTAKEDRPTTIYTVNLES